MPHMCDKKGRHNGVTKEGKLQTDLQMRIRLPPDLDEWIEQQARENCRSKTAEIVFRLQKARKVSEIPAAGSASQA